MKGLAIRSGILSSVELRSALNTLFFKTLEGFLVLKAPPPNPTWPFDFMVLIAYNNGCSLLLIGVFDLIYELFSCNLLMVSCVLLLTSAYITLERFRACIPDS